MKRLKTPQEKKRLTYENEYITQTEYPHAFRKQWPKKEAIAEREYRRKINQILNTKTELGNIYESFDAEIKQVKRRIVKKWGGPKTLKEIVPINLHKRIKRFAWNYFKNSYSRELDFERFSNLLNTVMTGKTRHSYQLAMQFELWLQPLSGKESIWLNSFFIDAPALKTKLLLWIAEAKQKIVVGKL